MGIAPETDRPGHVAPAGAGVAVLPGPLGPLTVHVDHAGAVTGVAFGRMAPPTPPTSPAARRTLACLAEAMARYTAGEPETFAAVPVALTGMAPFTRTVLRTCADIPYGQTMSYGELADAVGHPRAARAVGNALGANPVAVLVPCHRVCRSDGSLGGFTGGLVHKQALLALEREAASSATAAAAGHAGGGQPAG